MAKQTKICACGHTVPIDFDQEQIELTGKVSDLNMLDLISYKAETTELYKGIELYYYYEEDTLKFIDDGSAPKAKFKNLCESCLLETLQTYEPHYGDGVYLTQHKQLFDNATHEEVKKSHGISYRKHRATYVCLDESVFRKIYKTGGVVRSCKHTVQTIGDKKMVSVDDGVLFQLYLDW
ncbi:hypothetical protein [Anoxybacillus flavithermus]|uniref:Uncharacterized protein n=1 Tax=Anoxybacillus flavithermus TaxID=33934 RepID=A0AAX1ZZ35_9BACL|nr:hypothetical protein [Anoxybacillus flavithermus]RWU13111.1 hypothetical protein EA138_08785 [Anoxybacillus flavithermus]